MAGQPTLAVHISLTLRPKSVYSNLAEELLSRPTLGLSSRGGRSSVFELHNFGPDGFFHLRLA
jgi:hypothetical protein